MPHFADPDFWRHYRDLPLEIRELADRNYALLKDNSSHPSLHLKRVRGRAGLWSARVGGNHGALAIEVDGGLLWFWIGNHAEYDRMIA